MTNEYFLAEFCNLYNDTAFEVDIDYTNYLEADNKAAVIVWGHVLLGLQMSSVDSYTKLIPQ